MAIRVIRVYPDPVLRVKCPPVEDFGSDLRALAEDMVETMYTSPGVGPAAPQIGVETRLAVVDITVGEEPENLIYLANPEIVESKGQEADIEGCLSIPGISDKVDRAARIVVEAHDLAGRLQRIEAEGLVASAIQHEIDHLDGVLFTDHLTGLRGERARRRLKRLSREIVETPA
jgi:peptide deformylase